VTFHQLRILCALARQRSFTRAGEQLLLSQPAVTLQMKELQNTLGIPLYEYFGKEVHLTDAGVVLERYARRILTLVEEAQQVLKEMQGLKGGRVRIGTSNTPGIVSYQ